MKIRPRPELEKLVEEDVQRGPYQTADEFVERAVVLLHEQESWLAENRAEIRAKIGEGCAAAERGELIDSEEVHRSMDEKERAELQTVSQSTHHAIHSYKG
jgi:Arc/MetJ-type ribon-helix-helix transcriptional regulator